MLSALCLDLLQVDLGLIPSEKKASEASFIDEVARSPSSETQGQSVGSGEKARRKFSTVGERAPGYRLSQNYFQKFKRMPAPNWAQKLLCIIVPNRRTVSPEFFSWVRTRRLLSCHDTCPVRSPSSCEQGKLVRGLMVSSPIKFSNLQASKRLFSALVMRYVSENRPRI